METGKTETTCGGKCKQETPVALIHMALASIDEHNRKQTQLIEKSLKILQGTNGEGLTTRVAVNRTRIKQLVAWLTVITSGICAIAWAAIKHVSVP